MSPANRTLMGLGAGLALGLVVNRWHGLTIIVSLLEPLGTLWVNAIRMTVVPLVVCLIVAEIGSRTELGSVGRIGASAIALFVGMLSVQAFFSLLLMPPLLGRLPVDPDAVAALRSTMASRPGAPVELNWSAWLTGLVPANPIRAAAEDALLPLLVFALIFALALQRSPAPVRTPLVELGRAVRDVMLMLVRWVLAAAPVGVFALTLAFAARTGFSTAGALGLYVLLVSVLIVGQTVALYLTAAFLGGIPLRELARALAAPQAVALAGRSSLAALPATLPLAVATFKLAAPLAWIAGAVFLGRLYGVELPVGRLAALAVTAIGVSLSVPGIPSGSFLLMTPMLSGLGLPAEGLGILLGADAIPDTARGVLNVTADMTVTVILGRRDRDARTAQASGQEAGRP